MTYTLCPIRHGTQAVIRRKDGTAFREFALFLHDFALLFDGKGNPLNPPEQPGSHDDPGVMGINYRCETMRERLKMASNIIVLPRTIMTFKRHRMLYAENRSVRH